ncbi:hypothetical protein Krac_6105 [Ktedonobacter racemifer DSM 44963]|uniref:Uncharacterized protein n=1 Tax=Ktedonobacter racemifer DSM 44963 TaxID=485913 RepID=D6TXY0_KTERA|nr:hypothetical protein Krac_6105 [Ktedonobacter racemifer DSM 44963]
MKRFWTGGPLLSLSNGSQQAAWMKEESPAMYPGECQSATVVFGRSMGGCRSCCFLANVVCHLIDLLVLLLIPKTLVTCEEMRYTQQEK